MGFFVFLQMASLRFHHYPPVEKVEYKDGDTTLEGLLVVDTAKLKNNKGSGVVVFHDWKGVGPYVQMRAQQLADMGYVAFVADVYGKGVRPKDNKEAGNDITKGAAYNELADKRSFVAAKFF